MYLPELSFFNVYILFYQSNFKFYYALQSLTIVTTSFKNFVIALKKSNISYKNCYKSSVTVKNQRLRKDRNICTFGDFGSKIKFVHKLVPKLNLPNERAKNESNNICIYILISEKAVTYGFTIKPTTYNTTILNSIKQRLTR